MKLPTLIGEESAELLDLAALVEGVVAERARTLSPELQLIVDVASNLSRIHGVRSDLERLVSALLELWLASAGTGGVALVVDHTDDGHGVRLEVLNTSPEPSASASSPRLDRGDALRVVLGVVGRHDATLRVASHAQGATRLEIVFPLARASDRAARCRRPTQPLPRVRPIH